MVVVAKMKQKGSLKKCDKNVEMELTKCDLNICLYLSPKKQYSQLA